MIHGFFLLAEILPGLVLLRETADQSSVNLQVVAGSVPLG
jgi:hypothetical protein